MALDPQASTAALIYALGAPALAKAATYTTGEHWLLLWGLVAGGVVAWVPMGKGLLEKVDARLSRRDANARAFAAGIVSSRWQRS
jgi:STE24 endopeptidase